MLPRRRHIPRWATLALLVALCPVPCARAEETAFEAAWKARVERLVAELESVAAWCQRAKLFRSRDEVLELVLHFDPDNAAARKRLKFTRDASGAWVRPGSHKPPRNMAAGGAEEVAKRLAVPGGAFAVDVAALLERYGADVPPDRRSHAVRCVLRVAPDDREMRAANQEVETPDRGWLLVESVRGAARRKEVEAAAAEAQARAAEPERARPTQTENRIRIGWSAILQGRHVRLLGTPPAEELRAATRRTDACFPLYRVAVGRAPPDSKGLTMYLLQSDAERKTLLANHPRRTDEHAKRALQLDSSWFPKTRMLFIRSGAAPRRLEWCVRQAFGFMLIDAFRVSSRIGWAYEGFGLYLSHLITGTRQTHFVRPTAYEGTARRREEATWEKLRKPDADWRAEARAMLSGPDAPDLRLLLGKGVDTMNAREMLYSYVLAAYCVEAHPGKVAGLLSAFGKEKLTPDEALRRGLGMSVEDVRVRLARWLQETP